MKNKLSVSSSPHIRHEDTTQGIMLDVIIALLPAAAFGCFIFGFRALAVLLTTVAFAVLSEYLWNIFLKKPQSIGDLSAIVTGLLLGMNLPPNTPIWMAAIGSIAAIIVVKQMFGGLGFNFANPAITARIILLVSFSSKITTFTEPISHTVSSPTPLALEESATSFKNLFFGMHGGCIGETSAFLLLMGGLMLVIRKVIKPTIPLSFIGSFALCSAFAGQDVLKQLLMGGVIIGAIFMATDYTTSPTTNLGKLIFGIGCGVLTFIIRNLSNLPEGVSYAILLMNILTPHINTLTLKKPFGLKEVRDNE